MTVRSDAVRRFCDRLRIAGRRGFSLLELLSVIVLLTMLWALVFPASDAIRRASRRREALTEAQSLATAVLNFRDTYGRWPLQVEIDGRQTEGGALDVAYGANVESTDKFILLPQARLIRALTPEDAEENPRRIAFLDIDTDRLHDGCFLDPWSSSDQPAPYVVAVDANGDGWIGQADGSTPAEGVLSIRPLHIENDAGQFHEIPAIRETVYAFSWSGGDTNRVSTGYAP